MPQDQLEVMPEDDWYGEEVATFGDRLAAAREAGGLKRGEFAKRLGVKKSTIAAWEDDLGEPRANRLSMLAGVLNVSMMWLINGDGEGVTETDFDDGDITAILAELRTLRADMTRKAEQVGRLEKRLRQIMKDMRFDGTA